MENSQINPLKRVFNFNELVLEDPNPAFEPQEVLEFYANTYPELTSASVEEGEITPEQMTYTFKIAKGTKG